MSNVGRPGFGQIVDLSQFKNKKPEPQVEVKTITEDMVENNPVLQRAIELQKEDEAKVDPMVSVIMALLNVFLDNSKLKQYNPDEVKMKLDENNDLVLVDGEPIPDRDDSGNILPAGNPRQEFVAGIVDEVEKLIAADNNIKRDVKYGYIVLAKCMNLLSRLFYSDHNEYLTDLRKAYEIAVRDAVNPILQNNKAITTRTFYTIPGSIVEYVAWNDNLDKAAAEANMIPKVESDTAPDEVGTQTPETVEDQVGDQPTE